jgi:hypothetical protein
MRRAVVISVVLGLGLTAAFVTHAGGQQAPPPSAGTLPPRFAPQQTPTPTSASGAAAFRLVSPTAVPTAPSAPVLSSLVTASPTPSATVTAAPFGITMPSPVAGMDWLGNTVETAPLFQPDQVRDTALMAGGPSSAYADLLAADDFGQGWEDSGLPSPNNDINYDSPEGWDSYTASTGSQSLTPANGYKPQVWSVSDCNWSIDVLETDYQLDSASQPQSYYAVWSSTWKEAIDLADMVCINGHIPGSLQVQNVVQRFTMAEQIHQAGYASPGDTWSVGWADSYLALIQLYRALPDAVS